jgi:hypothetical protein
VIQAAYSTSTSENRKLAVLMRMALMYADAAGAEPDAELLDPCMTSAVASPLAGYCGSAIN